MDEMVREARKHGAEVVFVMLPVKADLAGQEGVRRFLPDVYARTLRIVQSRNFVVVDGRRALLSSKEPVSQFFHEDGIHYRPAANKVIADALRPIVNTGYLKETEGL
jgi:poly-D-alanine transfer protein DltD